MTSIIFAHPWHGSFNKSILDAVERKLNETGKEYNIIDLNKDGFNPTMTEADLALYAKGEYTDPLVGRYQQILKNSNQVVFIFPVWWGTSPAILRGFFDKVFLVNFSHNYNNGWTPLLNINRTLVITTSQEDTANLEIPIGECFVKKNLEIVGFSNVSWINCEKVHSETDDYRQAFIDKVVSAI